MTTEETKQEEDKFAGWTDEQRAEFDAEIESIKRLATEADALNQTVDSAPMVLMKLRTERMVGEARMLSMRSELLAAEKANREDQKRAERDKAAEEVYQREIPKYPLGHIVRYASKFGLVLARCPDPKEWLEWQQVLWKKEYPDKLAAIPGLVGPKVIHPSHEEVAQYANLQARMWEELYDMISAAITGLRADSEKKF